MLVQIMNQKGDGEMTTATALPQEKGNFKKGLLGGIIAIGHFLTTRGMHKERIKVNVGQDGRRLPIKSLAKENTSARNTNNLIPGIEIGAERGPNKSMHLFITLEGERFDIDETGHLKNITKANEKWEKAIATAKGITDYSDKHKAVVAYAKKFYLENKPHLMVALGRICQDTQTTRDEIFALFPGEPRRAIAMIAGLPQGYKFEPLEK